MWLRPGELLVGAEWDPDGGQTWMSYQTGNKGTTIDSLLAIDHLLSPAAEHLKGSGVTEDKC